MKFQLKEAKVNHTLLLTVIIQHWNLFLPGWLTQLPKWIAVHQFPQLEKDVGKVIVKSKVIISVFHTYQLRWNTLDNFFFHPINNVCLSIPSMESFNLCLIILCIRNEKKNRKKRSFLSFSRATGFDFKGITWLKVTNDPCFPLRLEMKSTDPKLFGLENYHYPLMIIL